MRNLAVFGCLIISLPLVAAFPTPQAPIDINGDWNLTATENGGALHYGAWRIAQQHTNLDVVSRWAQIEDLRQSSGTISENGRVLIIAGPVDGWMESFSGLVSADRTQISGTWSRVEGTRSVKGTFVAQRAGGSAQGIPPANPRAATQAGQAPPMFEAGTAARMVEAPGSQQPSPTPEPALPAGSTSGTPAGTAGGEQPVLRTPAPAVFEPPDTAGPSTAPDVDTPAMELSELESLLAGLVEQNQLLIRQAADVRNQASNKDQLIASQLERQRHVFKLLEKLIHSKVELEELLELFRRNNRVP